MVRAAVGGWYRQEEFESGAVPPLSGGGFAVWENWFRWDKRVVGAQRWRLDGIAAEGRRESGQETV
jgi:hypothetical protein